MYPTGVRSFCSGVSAAAGKAGALVAAATFSSVSPACPAAALPLPCCRRMFLLLNTWLFSPLAPPPPRQPPRQLLPGRNLPTSMPSPRLTQISPRAAFYASAGAGLLGFLLTVAFLPDTTGLDLHEIDRWAHVLASRGAAQRRSLVQQLTGYPQPSVVQPQAQLLAAAGKCCLAHRLPAHPPTLVPGPHSVAHKHRPACRMNRYLMAGQLAHYHGEGCNPRFLSWWERWRRYDEHYMPDRDYVHKQLQRHPHMPAEPPPSRQTSPRPTPRSSRRWLPGAGSSVGGSPRPGPVYPSMVSLAEGSAC